MTSVSIRDPYPFEKYENDLTLSNFQKMPKKEGSTMNDESFKRLSSTQTFSSLRRSNVFQDQRSPKDSLDFLLKTQYNNHREFLKNKNEVCLQKETLGLDSRSESSKSRQTSVSGRGRVLPTNCPKIVISESNLNPHNIKNTISGHHTQTTNGGYSRKPDGGLYNS